MLLLLEILLIRGCIGQSTLSVLKPNGHAVLGAEFSYDELTKRDLLALMTAYPGYITGFKKGGDGCIYVVMRSGKSILYDDKKTKTTEQNLAAPDLQDMMAQPYPLSDIRELASGDADPGRIRVYTFFHAVYGAKKSDIASNLLPVRTGTKKCLFNRNNDAATALMGAFTDVSALLLSDPSLYAFVYPLGGTFNYRVVAGTNRLSMHSFGIAVDLNLDKFDYWQFATRPQGQKRLEIYPAKLVRIFESHGFIWGGKWAHFDIVHYEYRPELIVKAKYNVQRNDPRQPWYLGFPDTPSVRNDIGMIEKGMN